jgi:glycosyltransferase involved in cell wall biosynthesis
MRLGIIARSDNTGLGNQTRELVNMLNPDKILLIDSTPFNKNKQHPEWYEKYNCIKSHGFPSSQHIKVFLNDIDVVLSCETFYDQNFIKYADKRGVKTILQYNYELFGHLSNPNLPLPTVLLSPSIWEIDTIKRMFGNKTKVIHLPPPTNEELFYKIKENNLSKSHNKILHIAGKKAAKDRNGTNTVIDMLKYSKENYQLVIKSQSEIETAAKDPRLTIEIGNPSHREDMYNGFDAMVLPRRYAGLCLPMNEALLSALPVFMTNVSPNNHILPSDWLIKSDSIGTIKTKVRIDLFEADPRILAKKIDDYIILKDKESYKKQAYEIGINNFSPNVLKQQYLELISQI